MISRAAKSLEKTRSAQRSAVDRKFRERHPERAAEERSFRKLQSLLDRERDYARAGTPETLEKARHVGQGALARMFMSGSISADQLAWSAEIRIVAERIASDVRIGTMSQETRVDQSRHADGTFFEKLGAVRAEVAYSRWRAWLPAATAVLAMIVGDEPCSVVAKRLRKDTRTVRKSLVEALDAWPHFQREAREEIDEATVLAAYAAIL